MCGEQTFTGTHSKKHLKKIRGRQTTNLVGGPNPAAACLCPPRFMGTQPCPLTYILSDSRVEWLPAKPTISLTQPLRAVALLQRIGQPPSRGPEGLSENHGTGVTRAGQLSSSLFPLEPCPSSGGASPQRHLNAPVQPLLAAFLTRALFCRGQVRPGLDHDLERGAESDTLWVPGAGTLPTVSAKNMVMERLWRA